MALIQKLDRVVVDYTNTIFAVFKTFDDVTFRQGELRIPYFPGSDITLAPDQVKSVAGALWTPEVISSYQNSIIS